MIEDSAGATGTERTVDFGAVFAAADGAMVVYDREDGRVLDANPRFCELLGYDREAVRGASVESFGALARDDRIDDGRTVRFGCEAETADGGVLPVEVALRPAGDGTAVATVRRPPSGTAGDPGSEPGAGRGRLEERNEHLRLLNRILRHDVRNDMAVVHGWSEELAETLDGRRGEIADGIRESSEHVVGITGAVGDLMDAIDGDAAGSAVDLREVLLGELDRREATFPDATFEVGSVPDVEVAADDLLGSVFRNLLNNAVQHSDRPRPRVEVSVEATDRSVVVSVADDGPGIPDGRREAVFGRTEEGLDHPAAGLGLYLVDALVSKYGGDVWVEDRRPRGAVFRVELPRVRAGGRRE